MSQGLHFHGAVVSYAKHESPHWVASGTTTDEKRPNGDFAAFNQTGLYVADGVGATDRPEEASAFIVTAVTHRAQMVRLSEMDVNEAAATVRGDVLPYADHRLGEYKAKNRIESASTTLGALLIARNGLVVVGAGDTPVYGLRPGVPLKQLTREQEFNGKLANFFGGYGRMNVQPGQVVTEQGTGQVLPHEMVLDQVKAIGTKAGDRFAILSDGVVVGADHVHIPLNFLHGNLGVGAASTPEQAAHNLANLPHKLELANAVFDHPNEAGNLYPIYYSPRFDDTTAGVLFVR